MSNEVWDGNDQVFEEVPAETNTYIRVNGANMSVTPGVSFIGVVKDAARDAGLGKFRVFLNDTEVKPSEAPEMVQEGSRMELRPYDVAG